MYSLYDWLTEHVYRLLSTSFFVLLEPMCYRVSSGSFVLRI